MKVKKLLMSACVLSLSASPAFAFTWDGGAGTTNWYDAVNWDTDTVPTTGSATNIDSVLVTVAAPGAVASDFRLGVTNGAAGNLTVSGGGRLDAGYAYLGFATGTTSILTVDGAGSVFTSGYNVAVGYNGTGTLNVTNDGRVDSSYEITLGNYAGASGTVNITGGGDVVTNNIEAASAATTTGTIVVDGAGSSLSANNGNIGNAGTGGLTVLNGAAVTIGSVTIGNQTGSSGSMTVDGAGSTFTGYVVVAQDGLGTLDVTNGGVVNSPGDFLVAAGAGSQGTVNIDGASSAVNAPSFITIGGSGEAELNVTNGGQIISGFVFVLGSNPDGEGIVTLDGNGSLLSTGVISVGQFGHGELTMTNGADLTAPLGFIVGDWSGTGTVLIDGVGSTITTSGVTIGQSNALGAMTISGGATVDSTNTVYVGYDTGSNGSLIIDDAGSALTTADIYIGNSSDGTLTLKNGGTATTNNLYLGVNAGSAGMLNIGAVASDPAAAAGTLDTDVITFGDGTGIINLNHTDLNYVLDADLIGNGTLNFIAGLTALTGDTSAFTGVINILNNSSAYLGNTNVDGGTLKVSGSLGGTTTIAGNGRVQGTGTLDDLVVDNGGTAAPGNSIGTLSVASVTFNPGSVYEVEINRAGQSDLMDVSGAATLNGGTVRVIPYPNVRYDSPYTILTAAGGVTGTFDGAETNYVFFNPFLTYDANNVYLSLTRSAVFEDIARTQNQRAVARRFMFQEGAAVDALYAMTDEDEARLALDKLSGEIHASTAGALMKGQSQIRGVFENNGSEIIGSGNRIWIAGLGQRSETGATVNTAQMDGRTSGVMTGIEHRNDGVLYGAGIGYSDTSVKQSELGSKAEADSVHAVVYGATGIADTGVILSGGVSGSFHDIETRRHIAFGTFDDVSEDDYNAQTGQVFAELSKALPVSDSLQISPYAKAAYVVHRSGDFSEDGEAGLKGGSEVSGLGSTVLGARIQKRLEGDNIPPPYTQGGHGLAA